MATWLSRPLSGALYSAGKMGLGDTKPDGWLRGGPAATNNMTRRTGRVANDKHLALAILPFLAAQDVKTDLCENRWHAAPCGT